MDETAAATGAPTPTHAPSVPAELRGCWRRAWIEYADGTRDDTSVVIWLQLASDMADVRVPAAHPLRERAGFDDCSLDELRSLADSESSSGRTTCTPVVTGADGVPRATAEWHSDGDGVAFQPVSAFPEPGVLEWPSDTVMIERAPSGAYVEEWHLLPGTHAPASHHVDASGCHVYRSGDAAVLVRDRSTPVQRAVRLDELVAECGDDRARLVALVDCEFSFALARRGHDGSNVFVVEASTIPWRVGEVLDVDLR
ncbi:MAG: hypothetical protein U0Q03_04800 [Acidimicrobiales bacterium]